MKALRERIQSAIQGGPPLPRGPFERILWAVSRVYGRLLAERARWYAAGRLPSWRLPCTVVSVGNITVGGTGKTPMTLRLARDLADAGIRTAIVSRGYGGAAEAAGGIVSNGRTLLMDASESGDEPCMMAEILLAEQRAVPVVVGRDRYAAGMQAVDQFAPEVILLDDGFQHLRVARDLNLLLLDGRTPFGNGHVLPRGSLREPLSALARADAVILTRCPPGWRPDAADRDRLPRDARVFRADHRPLIRRVIPAGEPANDSPPSTGSADGAAVFAFSGIARNDAFFQTVDAMGFHVAGRAEFPDHHPYTPPDLAALSTAAAASGAAAIATTEKDYARIDRCYRWPLHLFIIGIEMDFGPDEPAFRRFIRQHTGAPRRLASHGIRRCHPPEETTP